jgi:hypothetical protein
MMPSRKYDWLKGPILRTALKKLPTIVACMLFAAVAVHCAKDIRTASSSVAIANNASPIKRENSGTEDGWFDCLSCEKPRKSTKDCEI